MHAAHNNTVFLVLPASAFIQEPEAHSQSYTLPSLLYSKSALNREPLYYSKAPSMTMTSTLRRAASSLVHGKDFERQQADRRRARAADLEPLPRATGRRGDRGERKRREQRLRSYAHNKYFADS